MTHSKRLSVLALLVISLLVASLAPLSVARADSVAALARGKILVANESVNDPNFSKTVVLLLHYGDSGAMGVVLNRPSTHRLEHLLPDSEWSARSDEPIYVGGPVAATHMTMLFTTSERRRDQLPVVGSVHATWNLELLEQMLSDPGSDDRFRIYAGHAGWAPGQLEAEVERLGWYIFPATEADIFTSGEEGLWGRYIRRTRTLIAGDEADSSICESPFSRSSGSSGRSAGISTAPCSRLATTGSRPVVPSRPRSMSISTCC